MLDNTKNWKDKMQALKNHASPIDLPLGWDALENRMEKRKRRKIIYWLWPTLLGFALISGYFLTKDIDQKTTPPTLSSNKTTVAMNLNHDSLEEVKGADQASQKNHMSTQYIAQNKNAKSKTECQQASLPNKTKSSASIIQKHTKPSEIQTNKEVDLQVFAEDKNTTETHIVSNIGLQIESEKNLVKSNDNMEHTEAISVPFLGPVLGEVKYDHPIPNIYPQVVLQNKSIPFFVDIKMMAGFSNYKYKSQQDENIDLVNQRKNYEKPLENISSRLSLGKVFHQKWYASLGMSYHRLNEKWQSSKFDTTTLVVPEQILESYTNHLGQVVETKGVKQAKQVSAVTQTRYNTVEFMTTTFALGKYFHIRNIRWALEANLSIPFYGRFSGKVWDNSGQMTGLESVYQSSNSLQYGMHTSYIYPVSGNLAIYGGYDYNFSRFRSDLGYFRTQHLHSLSLGLKYYITK